MNTPGFSANSIVRSGLLSVSVRQSKHRAYALKLTVPFVAIQFFAIREANRSANDTVNKDEIRLQYGANTSQLIRMYNSHPFC